MTSSPAEYAELRELIAALREQTLSTGQAARLNAILARSSSARDVFARYAMLQATAELNLTGARSERGEEVPVSPSVANNRRSVSGNRPSIAPPLILETNGGLSPFSFDEKGTVPFGSALPTTSSSSLIGPLLNWACIALIVGIAVMIGWECKVTLDRMVADNAPRQAPVATGVPLSEPMPPKTQAPGVAQITGMVDCRWAEEEGEREGGGRKAEGGLLSSLPSLNERVPLGRKYALASGLMEIAYDSGAKVILQGPCTYEVDSATGGFLSLGKLTARAEKKADGGGRTAEEAGRRASNPPSALPPPPSPLFSIRTPIALLTDLGTEFGVEVDSSGVTGSHVFRGRIRMRSTIDVDIFPSPSGRGAGGEGDGQAVELKADESGRVAWGENGQVAVTRETGQVSAFVREMPRSAAVPAALSGQDARAPTSPLSSVYRLTDLGVTTNHNVALNAAGQVVGEVSDSRGAEHAFLYADRKIEDLRNLVGGNSCAFGINSRGEVVGRIGSDMTNSRAFLYSGGTMTNLGTLGGRMACAAAINDIGQVVGFSQNFRGVTHAFLYTPGAGMKDLGALGGPNASSHAVGINAAGLVVGDSEISRGVTHAFLYSAASGMTDLNTLGGEKSCAYRVNDAGQVVGFSAIGNGTTDHAFLYSHDTGMADLGTLGGSKSIAVDINNRGQVVGYAEGIAHGAAYIHSFLRSDGKMIDLDALVDPAAGWSRLVATAINDSGQIAGHGTSPDGTSRAFLLTPEKKPTQEETQTH